MVEKIIDLNDIRVRKVIETMKHISEDGGDKKEILKNPFRGNSKSYDEAISKLKYKIALYEKEFFRFSKSTVMEGDEFVFFAFLTSHFKTVLKIMSMEEDNPDYDKAMNYLDEFMLKCANQYILDSLGDNE